MGTIKLELDIPNFDRELKIEITVHKDGEVVYSASPSSKTVKEEVVSESTVEKKSDTKSKKSSGGNMMGLDNI